MTKEDKKFQRKLCKIYSLLRTSCREKDVLSYRRFFFSNNKHLIWIKNNPYYEFRYDVVVKTKGVKHLTKYTENTLDDAMKIVCIWLSNEYKSSYSYYSKLS